MALDYTLSRQAADALFDDEAILLGDTNGIPEYRIAEIFGEWAGVFIEENTHHNGYLTGGRDYNSWGDCGSERPILHYFYRRGFYKIVSEHNYRITLQNYRSNETGIVNHTVGKAGDRRKGRGSQQAKPQSQECRRVDSVNLQSSPNCY